LGIPLGGWFLLDEQPETQLQPEGWIPGKTEKGTTINFAIGTE
jgi:hypothetical protein